MQETDSSAGLPTIRTLLACGLVAGPLFLVVFVIQILIRPEFHFAHSEPSLLSIGRLGWIQIANFIIGGLLVISGSYGHARSTALPQRPVLGTLATWNLWTRSGRCRNLCR